MKFEKYVTPEANPVYARYKFHNKVQGQHEPVEQFVTQIKLLAKDCSFKDPEDKIRDRIVFGINSSRERKADQFGSRFYIRPSCEHFKDLRIVTLTIKSYKILEP